MSRLQDDLFQDFKEQKTMIENQLEMLGPLEARLHKRAATRLIGKGVLVMLEILCYALTGGAIAMAVLMNGVFPFRVWVEIEQYIIENKQELAEGLQLIGYAIAGTFVLVGILFLVIGRMLSSIRRKNDIIHNVSKDLKSLAGQHLNRKAAIHSIESRHFMDDSISEKDKEDEWVEDVK